MRYRPPSQRKTHDWKALSGDNRGANEDATAIIAYLIAGPVVYAGAGYLLDSRLGTGYFVVIGALLGACLSLYLVWLRYGRR